MNRIHVLSQDMANLIAAGEVVERPSSIVKELVENAVDAGATSITVEIKNGGTSYIRVTDNGRGMSAEDASVAFLPHATSKIRTPEDLNNINSLGFRGEALPSIAAVSRVTMLTRTEESPEGFHVQIEGGKFICKESAGCPKGTTMIVRDVFYNTPARQKFLKKDGAEMASITDVCQKQALARPDISFTYISNLKEVFFTPGDGELYNSIFAIYTKAIADNMLGICYEANNITVKGYIGTAAAARPNRNMQIFFVNGRPVVNKTMQAALAESYKQMLTVGKYPSAVLFLTVSPQAVDVNVHPAKTEVKFQNEHDVFDVIYWGVKNALHEKPYVPQLELGHRKQEPEKTQSTVLTAEDTEQKTEYLSSSVGKVAEPTVTETAVRPLWTVIDREQVRPVSVVQTHRLTKEQVPTQEILFEEPKQTEIETEKQDEFEIIGQAFKTYIMAQKGDTLYFIDQHAAHERLKYEALIAARREKKRDSQVLLMPITVNVSAYELSTFEENEEFFENLGFEIEQGGDSELLVRMIPCDVPEGETEDLVLNILTLLLNSKKASAADLEGEALYTVACKAALKSGKTMSLAEQMTLVKDVFALAGINTCPHGRPIVIEMTKQKIEKEFKRI